MFVIERIPYIANRSRWKSFMVCKTKLLENIRGKHLRFGLVWPKPTAQAISLENFRGYQSIRENCETFPPRTIFNMWYCM